MNETPLRILWFLLVGWWAAGLWLCVCLLLCCTLVGIPVAYVMARYTKGIALGPSFE